MNKRKKIGLIGFGNAGKGFYELLTHSKDLDLEIKIIGIKNKLKPRDLDQSIFTTSIHEIINDPDIDIIVELIDDATIAFEILTASLRNNKPFVSANKKMLAEHFEEILFLQKKYHTPVLYEGAVCGSIPVIRNLESYFKLDQIKKIEGILNGSTNYILTRMSEEKKAYADALEEAQQLGFAESDPTLDVKGIDAKYKLTILIAHAFKISVDPQSIVAIGIDRITQQDLRYAKQQGYDIKLIAKCEKIGNELFAVVAPQFVPVDSPLEKVKDEFNGVCIEGEFAGNQIFTGKGAGSLPTGLAVLSDVATLAKNPLFFYESPHNEDQLSLGSGLVNVQVGFTTSLISVQDFERFHGGFQGSDYQTMEGWITTERLLEWQERSDLSVILKSGLNMRPHSKPNAEKYELAYGTYQ